jgi:hypothetical protein
VVLQGPQYLWPHKLSNLKGPVGHQGRGADHQGGQGAVLGGACRGGRRRSLYMRIHILPPSQPAINVACNWAMTEQLPCSVQPGSQPPPHLSAQTSGAARGCAMQSWRWSAAGSTGAAARMHSVSQHRSLAASAACLHAWYCTLASSLQPAASRQAVCLTTQQCTCSVLPSPMSSASTPCSPKRRRKASQLMPSCW